MSKTSDRAEALSVAIARHFEKEPTPERLRDNIDRYCEPSSFWKLERRWQGAAFEFRVVARQITEPEIAMRLLKELLAKGLIVSIDEMLGKVEVACDSHVGFAPVSFAVIGSDVSQAIAEAVVKAFNLEVG